MLFFSLTGITLPVRAEVAIATNQATAAQGITTADSRIHYVIGIILGNVVYFWRRAERIERELDELREQRIARARGKIDTRAFERPFCANYAALRALKSSMRAGKSPMLSIT